MQKTARIVVIALTAVMTLGVLTAFGAAISFLVFGLLGLNVGHMLTLKLVHEVSLMVSAAAGVVLLGTALVVIWLVGAQP